ncbi:MAG: carbohydrate ABC transporter permease [Candidatus Sericytochromatia bacterium]|nr:carbohydrate ABC transporter permease [Candidatus Sericytochromatia bacterium]
MKQTVGKVGMRYLAMCAVAVFAIGPFLWLLVTALRGDGENIFQYPPVLWPEQPTLKNFEAVWVAVPFGRYVANSVVVALASVLLNLVLASLAAYPLARMRFRGRDFAFFAILATMMVPFPVIMIPLFTIVMKLHGGLMAVVPEGAQSEYWLYSWLVLPTGVSAFGIFLLRQAFAAIPKELEEAVLMDGGNVWDIWRKVMLPLSRPALATLAIFTFVGSWGDFLWPLVVLNDPQLYTLPVGVAYLAGTFSANWRLIAAGSVIAVIPIVVFFLLMQRHFIGDATAGAVKG